MKNEDPLDRPTQCIVDTFFLRIWDWALFRILDSINHWSALKWQLFIPSTNRSKRLWKCFNNNVSHCSSRQFPFLPFESYLTLKPPQDALKRKELFMWKQTECPFVCAKLKSVYKCCIVNVFQHIAGTVISGLYFFFHSPCILLICFCIVCMWYFMP